jgi:hypothetical protein
MRGEEQSWRKVNLMVEGRQSEMRKYRPYQCLVGIALLLGLALPAWAETIELVTYNPTTANIPDDLRLRSLTVGTAYRTTPTTLEDGVALISNRLGIGTTDPNEALHVSQPLGVKTAIRLDTVKNDPAGGSMLFLQHVRMGDIGTVSASLGLNANDGLGEVRFMGYDGAGYEVAAAILGLAEGTWTSGSNGSRPAMLQFYTRSAVAGDLPAERMRITSDGALELVGLNTPPAVSANDRGRIYYNATTDTFMISESGTQYRTLRGVRRMRVHNGSYDAGARGRETVRNPAPIDTDIRISEYPHAVAIFRGSTNYGDDGDDKRIWVVATMDSRRDIWQIDIEGDLIGSGARPLPTVHYSLLAWSDSD